MNNLKKQTTFIVRYYQEKILLFIKPKNKLFIIASLTTYHGCKHGNL